MINGEARIDYEYLCIERYESCDERSHLIGSWTSGHHLHTRQYLSHQPLEDAKPLCVPLNESSFALVRVADESQRVLDSLSKHTSLDIWHGFQMFHIFYSTFTTTERGWSAQSANQDTPPRGYNKCVV
jgi:hypothetical protein